MHSSLGFLICKRGLTHPPTEVRRARCDGPWRLLSQSQAQRGPEGGDSHTAKILGGPGDRQLSGKNRVPSGVPRSQKGSLYYLRALL